jgi:hypothetical protein
MAAEGVRHGAYIAVTASRGAEPSLAAAPIPELAAQLGLENEFVARDGHPRNAIAFLTRVGSTAGHLPDEAVSDAGAVIHVASNDGAIVSTFCAGCARLLRDGARVRMLSGTVQPTRYTGGEMHDFAYARQIAQRSGEAMPNAFLLPLQKLPEWWAKDWMERHTYFLPRYEDGRMVSEGHPLAAAAGIPVLMRRTYRGGDVLSPEGGYDFLTYFECADTDVPTFHAVCAALRDVRRNPEWQYVREGPAWHGRRAGSWSALWATP